MGDWQTPLGRAMRARRQELGLTLEEASKAIGISRSHLNLIELGKATGVSRGCVAKIDAGLDADGALLALLVTNGTEVGSEQMRRAEFNKAVIAFAASLLVDPDRLVNSRTVDAALLQDLESLTADLAHRQHRARRSQPPAGREAAR